MGIYTNVNVQNEKHKIKTITKLQILRDNPC